MIFLDLFCGIIQGGKGKSIQLEKRAHPIFILYFFHCQKAHLQNIIEGTIFNLCAAGMPPPFPLYLPLGCEKSVGFYGSETWRLRAKTYQDLLMQLESLLRKTNLTYRLWTLVLVQEMH